MQPRTRLLLVMLLAAFALAATWETVRNAMVPPPREDFRASDLYGRAWTLAEHRGGTPVLLNFFATW